MPKPKSKRPNPLVLKLRKNILVLLEQNHSLKSDLAQARAAQGYAERGWLAATEELSECRLQLADFRSSTEVRQENTRLRELLFERLDERAGNALRAELVELIP